VPEELADICGRFEILLWLWWTATAQLDVHGRCRAAATPRFRRPNSLSVFDALKRIQSFASRAFTSEQTF
jgi:hypothetical protein